jgi:hypothetical protein
MYSNTPNSLEERLSAIKIIINSNYGSNGDFNSDNAYSELYDIKRKVLLLKIRKSKIKNIFKL